ncbi:MAG TPA: hypothetical protein VMS98_03375 [Thermoanaerobaculia bacterium]|nr:hypothetical protein [Thermoanaerobaculia bacterium]
MAVRGEEVASSIEAHVREEVERMVGEIRSSIDDVRTAVDQQLKAALQSMQADVKSLSFLPHIQKSIAELAPASPAAAKTADATRVKRAIQEVERGKSQVDVLNALLEQCLHFGSRAALLILRGETFSGWKGAGFAAYGGSDETIKRFNAAPGAVPQLDDVLRQERVVEWDGANLAGRFGVAAPDRAILVPMVIKDKVAAAIYVDADAKDRDKLDLSSIQLLVFATGLLVDTLAIRKKIPSPSLSDESSAAAPKTSESTAAFSAAQIQEATTALPPPRPAPRPAAPAAFTPPPMDFSAPVPAPAPARMGSSAGTEDRPSTQFVPAAGLARGGAAAAPATEDTKKHDEARRFARLLVSEIKLYNESKVEQGRRNKDLYERLKEDIDRSRQMYDDRIAEEVRKASNYFYDELVRILADGHSESLGL